MTDVPDYSKPDDDADADDELRRILELELIKVRGEASAARLDARAAEIEMLMRRLVSTTSFSAQAPKRFGTWNEVRVAQSRWAAMQQTDFTQQPAEAAKTRASFVRFDSGVATVKRPRFLEGDTPEIETESKIDPVDSTTSGSDANTSDWSELARNAPVLDNVSIAADDDQEQPRRSRPAAWLVSAVAHLAILILLAGIGLKSQLPKDQVALSASATSASEESIETFEIQPSEAMPESEISEPVPSESEYEISPVGNLSATEFSPDAPPSPPTVMASAMSHQAMSASSAMSMTSATQKNLEFCGVEGGGNHFVYLVDSSGSMGDGFESAREALLQSIEMLTADQRFYVVFFDAQSDYMRVSNPGHDESRSVFATPANKTAIKRWALRIKEDIGKAPYEPLRFALGLKPDVIFLLSDGEFPQGIEDLLREENVVTNLFGESKPISIVHTIAYHSEEGESRMRRIAKQNMGQYRYVPKPK